MTVASPGNPHGQKNEPLVGTVSFKLAAEAQCDPRTIIKIYAGKASKTLVRERVEAAAKKLGIGGP